MKVISLSTTLALVLSQLAFAAPSSLMYQGRIVKSNGEPLEFNNVGFIFELTSPNGTCVIYREQKNGVNMVNSGGVFDVAIGTGTRQYPSAGTTRITDYFENSKSYNCGDTNNADTGSTYAAASGDGRKLRVSFWDGTGWQIISPDNEIRSVPYASYSLTAEKIGNISADNVAKKTDLPAASCSANEVLTFSSGAFSCVPDQLGTSGGGIVSFAGETGSSQSLAVNTSGTSLSWTSASNVHTLRIPLAATSGVTAGLLSNSDYTTFSGKQDALGFTPLNPGNNLSDVSNAATARNNLGLSTAGGDLTGSLPNPTIAKLQSKDITLSSLADKNVLFYNGTQWINKQLSITDISGVTMNDYVGYSALPANCAASKTMVFITPSNTFTCSDIAIASSQVSGLASSATTDTTNADNITSGTLDASRLPSSITDAAWTASSGNISRSSGMVGIGTANPTAELEVAGDIKISGSGNGISFPDGTTITSANGLGSGGGGPEYSVHVGTSTNSTLSGGWDIISWENEIFDNGGFHDTTTNTNRLTIPTGASGLYLVAFSAGAINTADIWVNILKNGSNLSPLCYVYDQYSGTSHQASGTCLLQLSGGDYLHMQVWGSGGGTIKPEFTWMSMTKLSTGGTVTGSALTNGKVLVGDSSGIASERYLNFGDLKNSMGVSQLPATPCTASQTLTWSSLLDGFTCSDISFSSVGGVKIPQLASDPASPSAGQIYFNSTTNKTMVYNGSSWEELGTGSGGGEIKRARTTLNANTTAAHNATTVFTLDTPAADNAGFWSLSQPTRLTIPSGVSKVRVCFQTAYDGPSASVYSTSTWIRKNGSHTSGLPMDARHTTYVASLASNGCSAILDVTAGDYFDWVFWQNSGSNITVNKASSWISIEEVSEGGGTAAAPSGSMQLTRNTSEPFTCDSSKDGYITATSRYTTCICRNGTGWVSTTDGTSDCAWQEIGIQTAGSGRRWVDGTYAPTCKAYLSPSLPYSYSGSTGDGVYTIDPDGAGGSAAFDVYCDMTTDGGGWTIIAKNISNAGVGASKVSTPVTSLSSGGSVWQVPTALTSLTSEILFIDISGSHWVAFSLDTAAKNYLSSTSTSNVSVNMTMQRHSGYRTCSYTTLDTAGYVFSFDFSDGYGWNASGFQMSASNYWDNPLISSSTVAYMCSSSGGSYYKPASTAAGIR